MLIWSVFWLVERAIRKCLRLHCIVCSKLLCCLIVKALPSRTDREIKSNQFSLRKLLFVKTNRTIVHLDLRAKYKLDLTTVRRCSRSNGISPADYSRPWNSDDRLSVFPLSLQHLLGKISRQARELSAKVFPVNLSCVSIHDFFCKLLLQTVNVTNENTI